MHSLKELYKIGRGPSSSHTMGPEKAIKSFKKELGEVREKYADARRTELVGSFETIVIEAEMPEPDEARVLLTRNGFIKRMVHHAVQIADRFGGQPLRLGCIVHVLNHGCRQCRQFDRADSGLDVDSQQIAVLCPGSVFDAAQIFGNPDVKPCTNCQTGRLGVEAFVDL